MPHLYTELRASPPLFPFCSLTCGDLPLPSYYGCPKLWALVLQSNRLRIPVVAIWCRLRLALRLKALYRKNKNQPTKKPGNQQFHPNCRPSFRICLPVVATQCATQYLQVSVCCTWSRVYLCYLWDDWSSRSCSTITGSRASLIGWLWQSSHTSFEQISGGLGRASVSRTPAGVSPPVF